MSASVPLDSIERRSEHHIGAERGAERGNKCSLFLTEAPVHTYAHVSQYGILNRHDRAAAVLLMLN